MRVAIEKLPGVAGAEVSLEEGLVNIVLEPGSEVALGVVRSAIRDQGFTPREARIRVSGRLEASGERLLLQLPRGDTTYAVVASGPTGDRLRALIGRTVLLDGRVPGDEEGRVSGTLEVTAIVGS